MIGGVLKYNMDELKKIFSNYYITTSVRPDIIIDDKLIPFGDFEQFDKPQLNGLIKHEQYKKIIEESKSKESQTRRVGDSSFGVYFRFIKKKTIEKYTIYNKNSIEYSPERSFLFEVIPFLEYILKTQSEMDIEKPLCYFNNMDNFGKILDFTFFLNNYRYGYGTNLEEFLNYIILHIFNNNNNNNTVIKPTHELISLIPIPINNDDAGFKGKINKNILLLPIDLAINS